MYQIARGKLSCTLLIALLIVATKGSIACKRNSVQRVAEGTAVEVAGKLVADEIEARKKAGQAATPTPTPDIVFIDGYKCSRGNYNTAKELRDRLDRLGSETKAKMEKLDDMKRHYDHLKALVDIACFNTTSSESPGCKSRLDEWGDYEKQYNYEITSYNTLLDIYMSDRQRYNSFLNINCE
jgi:hypothetical protein